MFALVNAPPDYVMNLLQDKHFDLTYVLPIYLRNKMSVFVSLSRTAEDRPTIQRVRWLSCK